MLIHSLFVTTCIAILLAIAQQFNGLNPIAGDFLGAVSLRCAVILGVYHALQAFVRRKTLAILLTIVTSAVGFTWWWKLVVSSGEYRITIPAGTVFACELGLTAILTALLSFFDQSTRRFLQRE